MRTCQDCGKQDQPYLEDAPCNCGCAEELRAHAERHRAECRSLGHEVVLYPVRIARSELWFDSAAQPHISAYYTGRGWKFKQDGGRFYRTKILCRDCIGKEAGALARKREYERLSKAARGIDTQTYAQMIASQ